MPRRSISHFNRMRIITLRQSGMSLRHVASRVGVSHTDVLRICRRFLQTHDVQDRPRTSKPRATTQNQDRYVRLLVRRQPFQTARQLRNQLQVTTQVNVTPQTIRNRLREVGLRSRRPWRGPSLNRSRKSARLSWARNHQNCTEEEWDLCLFCNETRISFLPDDHRERVWRTPGQRSMLQHSLPHLQQQGGSVMFWGGIMYGRRTPLVPIRQSMTGSIYLEQVLQPIVYAYRQNLGQVFTLIDDNVRPHRTRVINQYLQEHDIRRLQWPAYSPDMNPIEHAWDMLQCRVKLRICETTTVDDLIKIAIEEWDNLPQEGLNNLTRSMENRIRACIQARGGVTKY